MSINKIRSILRRINIILGDVNAVKRGKVHRRVKNRAVGRILGRLLKW